MKSQGGVSPGRKTERWIALVLCAAVLAARVVEHLVRNRSDSAQVFAPDWISLAAAGLAALGLVRLGGSPQWFRAQRAIGWVGLLLMVWTANGLLFDVLRVAGLIPLPVNWPGLATRTLALAAAVVLAHLALTRPAGPAATRPAAWYGYAAFVTALPYPVFRTVWALGGTLGLDRPGGGGQGWAPWLLAIPWLLAAAMSLLLVPTRGWMPRRLLLTAGWTATAIVGTIGPAACWALVNAWLWGGGQNSGPKSGVAFWVFGLFYGSWFLFAIAAGAATRSYQLRSARPADVFADATVSAGPDRSLVRSRA